MKNFEVVWDNFNRPCIKPWYLKTFSALVLNVHALSAEHVALNCRTGMVCTRFMLKIEIKLLFIFLERTFWFVTPAIFYASLSLKLRRARECGAHRSWNAARRRKAVCFDIVTDHLQVLASLFREHTLLLVGRGTRNLFCFWKEKDETVRQVHTFSHRPILPAADNFSKTESNFYGTLS